MYIMDTEKATTRKIIRCSNYSCGMNSSTCKMIETTSAFGCNNYCSNNCMVINEARIREMIRST